MNTASDALPSLPDDVEGLRALVLALMAERDSASATATAWLSRTTGFVTCCSKLKRMQFGTKSERLPDEQLQLGLEALEQAIARGEAEAEKRDPNLRKDGEARRRASRGALPAHLPRIEVTLAPEDTDCPCCKVAMTVIGEDRSERLDVIPAQFRVIVTRRPKLICRACVGTVVQMPAPARFDRGRHPHRGTGRACAGVALCRSPAAVSPGADHRTAGCGSRSLDFVVLDGLRGGRTRPVVRPAARDDAELDTAFADETVVPVLDPGRGRTSRATSGRSRVTTGHGAATSRRRWSITTRRARAYPRPRSARGLPRHPAMRWLLGLQEAGRAQTA